MGTFDNLSVCTLNLFLTLLNEAEIIKGCQQNSASAQKLLYTKYAPLLKSVCLRYIKDREEAKDVLHDGFLKIFNSISKYKGEGSFEGWMKRIMIHLSLDHIKKNQQKNWIHPDNFEPYMKEDETSKSISQVLLDHGFSTDELLSALHKIHILYSSVFNLFYIDNLNHKEIAETLGIDENTSRTRLHRAKLLLRKVLEEGLVKKQGSPIF